MKRVYKTFFRNEQGNAIIETPFAIIILMTVFLAGIYFLTAYRDKIVMEMAAKEGSRQYQITHDISYAKKELAIGNVANATVTASDNGVTITKNTKITIPIVGDYLFGLKASANYHVENRKLYYDNGSSSIGYTGNPYK